MKKFECKGCELHCELTPKETCLLPKCCPFAEGYEPVWHEVKEEEDPKLPKLTAEVFDRPECPKNVQYAVVTSEGRVIGYKSKPYINTFYNMHKELSQCWGFNSGCSFTISVVGTFDPSDWQNSLIERPTKALPDWVKVNNIGWHHETGYFKVIDVDDIEKKVRIQHINSRIKEHFSFNTVCTEAKHARPRPFNDKEMRGLVGKVIENPNIVLLVDSYGKLTGEIGTYCGQYTAESLMDNGFVIGDKPCFKLEHLNEKGEWVE